MKKYEYKTKLYRPEGFWSVKVDTRDVDDLLNEMGSQGWKFVREVPVAESYGKTVKILFIFEREVQ